MGYPLASLYTNYRLRSFNRHLRFFYGKHEGDINSVSRKTKKAILGRRWGKHELKRRLENVVVTKGSSEYETELSDHFCPKCGCEINSRTGNMTEWPEVWYRCRCLRCDFKVAEQDNGPWIHVLEVICGPEKEKTIHESLKYW